MNLSEIVRSGAQMMLQYALEREVTEALGRNYYENAPATTKEKGRRNGYESHRVLTGEGAVTVQVPRVRETEKVFQSKILDAYVSRTEKLDELIARMYVHGMSTRDIEATFADVLSGTGVSKSVVSRVTRCLSEDFEAFRKRDLSNEKLLYLELDGTYLRYHQGAERKEPILVATGYRADGTRVLLQISSDGKTIVFRQNSDITGRDIGMVRLEGESEPEMLLQTPFEEHTGMLSPDDRWLTYVSNESGREEIYVRPFPDLGGKWQVSTDGGTEPMWSRDGRELFYRNGDKMMAVAISTEPELAPGKPTLLFEGRYLSGVSAGNPATNYDVAPDGRFVMIRTAEGSGLTQINVVLNWLEELKRLVPTN